MGRERIVSLQILRFVAAAMVVFHHSAGLASVLGNPALGGSTGPVARVGAAGVDVFFVISGLVIPLPGPLATPSPSGAVLYLRRWGRVSPTGWAFVCSPTPFS